MGALIDTEAVAALLGVHPKHVYRLLKRGLPGQRIGRTWRFDEDDVRRWATGAGDAAPATDATPALLAANGDVVVERLLAAVNAPTPCLGLVAADRDHGLHWLKTGRALLAGCHGRTPPESWGEARLARVHLVEREFGLVFRRSAGTDERALAGLRWASRPTSAGIRGQAAAALAALGLEAAFLEAAPVYASHGEAVLAVARGDADAGIATRAWADRAGLHFQRLGCEAYGLVVHARHLGEPAVVRVCEIAQSSSFRQEIGAISGYDATEAGAVQFHFGGT